MNNQVGGYVTTYQGLTFATVRDAGHMVPETQPERALGNLSLRLLVLQLIIDKRCLDDFYTVNLFKLMFNNYISKKNLFANPTVHFFYLNL